MKRNSLRVGVSLVCLLVFGIGGCANKTKINWPVPHVVSRPRVDEGNRCLVDLDVLAIGTYAFMLEAELEKARVTIREINSLE